MKVPVPAKSTTAPITVPAYEVDYIPTSQQLQAELQRLFGTGKLLDIDKWTVTNVPTVPPPVTDKWYYWCKENEKVTVPPSTKCRYGVSATEKFNEKVMSGLITADNITFGDPAVGLAKYLYCNVDVPVVVQPPPTGNIIMVDAAAKGVKADNSTDNSGAFKTIALEQKMKPDLVEIALPTGNTILWDDNSWPAGLKKFHLTSKTGTSAIIKKRGGNDWFVSYDTFNNDGLFYPINGSGMGQSDLLPFAKIKSATKGSMTATFMTTSEAAKFPQGSFILLEGFETQGQGWPINPRFFEWKYIVSNINGVMTFSEPLKFSYNELWKDWQFPDDTRYQWGKPRVHLIDPFYPALAKFSNLIVSPQKGFLNQPNNIAAFHIGADVLECDNVDFLDGNVWPTINRIARYNNVKNGGWEADKLVGYMEVTNSAINSIWGATGVSEMLIKDSTFFGFSPMTPHRAKFENVKFNSRAAMATASLYAFRWWTGCLRWEFKGCTFPTGMPPLVIDNIPFTVGTVSGNAFSMPDAPAWDAPQHELHKMCYHGNKIKNSAGTVEAIMNDVIYQNGQYVVQFTPVKGTITNGMAMQFRQVAEVVDSGGNLQGSNPIILK